MGSSARGYNCGNCGRHETRGGVGRGGVPDGADPAPGTSQGLGASPGAAGVDAETLSPVAAARSQGFGGGGAPAVEGLVGIRSALRGARRWAGRGLARVGEHASARAGVRKSPRGESRTRHARFLTDPTSRVARGGECLAGGRRHLTCETTEAAQGSAVLTAWHSDQTNARKGSNTRILIDARRHSKHPRCRKSF